MPLTTRRAAMMSSRGNDRLHAQRRLGDGHRIEDRALFRAVRIIDDDLQHEAIDLRFGQRIGAFLFERILRRQDEERIGQTIASRRRA